VEGTSTFGDGVLGQASQFSTGAGVRGIWGIPNLLRAGVGVSGTSDANGGAGVYGEHVGNIPNGSGVVGTSNNGPGVSGTSWGDPGVQGTCVAGPGVKGTSSVGPGAQGTSTFWTGVDGTSTSGTGVPGKCSSPDFIRNRAGGFFEGGLIVAGGLDIRSDLSFRIDHPLAPPNRYLVHTCVESSERKNVYDGVARLNEDGAAWVELPEWFDALNGDFRYQPTAIGGAAPNLHVAEEISEQAGLPNAARRWAARRASLLVGQRFACTAAGAALLVTRASTHIYLPFIEKA
jgi:hypothetical protein